MFPASHSTLGDVYVKTGPLRGHAIFLVKISPWFAINRERGQAQGGFVRMAVRSKTIYRGELFEIVMQHLNNAPPSLRTFAPDLSPMIEDVVITALAKDPKQRFATIQAFAIAFEHACQA